MAFELLSIVRLSLRYPPLPFRVLRKFSRLGGCPRRRRSRVCSKLAFLRITLFCRPRQANNLPSYLTLDTMMPTAGMRLLQSSMCRRNDGINAGPRSRGAPAVFEVKNSGLELAQAEGEQMRSAEGQRGVNQEGISGLQSR